MYNLKFFCLFDVLTFWQHLGDLLLCFRKTNPHVILAMKLPFVLTSVHQCRKCMLT